MMPPSITSQTVADVEEVLAGGEAAGRPAGKAQRELDLRRAQRRDELIQSFLEQHGRRLNGWSLAQIARAQGGEATNGCGPTRKGRGLDRRASTPR
jgi:hypothetical protein